MFSLTSKPSFHSQKQRLPYNNPTLHTLQNPNSISPTAIATTRTSKPSIPVILSPNSKQEKVDGTYMGYEAWLPDPPKLQKPLSLHNAASLAFIGDCVYELYARRHFLFPPLSIEEYNDRVMSVARCEAQVALLKRLTTDNFLSKKEKDILRWGKNVVSTSRTRTKKRVGVAVYNRASSLETLIGHLYLTNKLRLDEIMIKLGFSVGDSTHLILDDNKLVS
jgi:ribonuclease-3 family protein